MVEKVAASLLTIAGLWLFFVDGRVGVLAYFAVWCWFCAGFLFVKE